MHPVWHMGDVRSVVERQFEIFRAIIYQMICENITIIENYLAPVVQFKVIEQALVRTIQNDLVIVMV